MCGIAGFSGDFEERLLYNMNTAIAHRGPDDSGIWFNQLHSIGLAHQRLSIIDTSSSGHQPMWDKTRQIVIVFNGEIYNFLEIKKDLIKRGFQFISTSDTEVLLNFYLYKGLDILTHLNGIFSFALWDTRDQTLFIARDGMGVKPFYYTQNKKGFLFSSELKALLQEPSVTREINPKAIQSYMTYLWCPSPHTPISSVKKLEPGHAMLVKNGTIKKHWKYYDLPYYQKIEQFSVEDAILQVRQHLAQAVKRQMVADVPVGAFLSGGLDSSAVATYAQECNSGTKLQCFTIALNQKESMACDGVIEDLPYAKKVADHLGVDLHVVKAGPEMITHLEKMIYHLDEPQADPAPINVLLISQLARKHGIKVLLSGAGGDDIFTGYRRHFALLQEKYWAMLPQRIREKMAVMAKQISPTSNFKRRLSKAFQYANFSSDDRIASYFFWIHPDYLPGLFGQFIKDQGHLSPPSEALISTLSNIPQTTHPLNKMLYLEGKHFLADHNLNYTDKMGMAEGVEIRVPLLDPDLVSLAARLPINFKQKGRIGKWIFKKAMEPNLPHNVIYRPKTGFGAPLRYWIRNQLRPIVEDVLSKDSIDNRGLFNYKGIARLVEMDQKGAIDAAYPIFSFVCIELWCRMFIDEKNWNKNE
ncbi:Asparagine synthetase [Candidatus Magnetomorum sp. HK-1]|nr:Asparagine synthetase [Candidatus Magnetomorum sp. HK-1]